VKLQKAYADIKRLKDQLEAESTYLQEEIHLEHNFSSIIGDSEGLKYVLYRTEQVAPTDSPVIILGETGTGKELIARAIHNLSPRSKRALVKVNCTNLPQDLFEGELFGHEKGAYTGATTRQIGRFELANGSTIFLDEIGEMPLALQAKLLRVLESGEFERLGSPHTLHTDARIIASTNRDIEKEVRQGLFREDLWYRLKVLPITLPPLRQRKEDIPLLVASFANYFSKKMGKSLPTISETVMKSLQEYPWPGNIRELKHSVESAMITSKGKRLTFEFLKTADYSSRELLSFEEMERSYIQKVLKQTKGKIQGSNSAASILKMHPNTLRTRMKKLGIKKPS
jgi:chemotaxis protein methyltransferase CheR